MVGDGEDTAREIVILRPEVQKRFFRGAADFPGESGERSNPSTVFANFDGAISGKFLETSLQFGREVHAGNYKGKN
jgi:hypothetical protein